MATTSDKSNVTAFLVYVVFVTTLGPLQFGYHLAELNAPQAVITCEKKSITSSTTSGLPQCLPMNPSQFGLVSSIYTLGGFVGALVSGPMATKSGRLLTLRASTAFFILGSAAEALSPNIAILSAGRFLSGIGAGASIVVGPIFVSEIAPAASRGFFGAFTQIMTNVGILLTQSLGYFFSRDSLWRNILAVGAILGIAEFVGLILVPETPAWLAEHRRTNQARQVLQRMRGKDVDVEEEIQSWKVGTVVDNDAVEEGEEESLLSQQSHQRDSRKSRVTILTVATNPEYRPALVSVVIVMLAQQFTGVNSIIMYSVSLLQDTLPTGASLLAVAISALNLVVTLACSPLPDKIGRKTCLLLSIGGMGSASVLLAIGISVNQKIVSALASLLFVASFAVGLGPVPFILASELVGSEAVGAIQSWALSTNWTATFVVAQFFPILNEALGGKGQIYWVFACLAALFGFLIYLRVPETRGKSTPDEVWGRVDERRID